LVCCPSIPGLPGHCFAQQQSSLGPKVFLGAWVPYEGMTIAWNQLGSGGTACLPATTLGIKWDAMTKGLATLLPPTKYASRGEFLAGKGQPRCVVSPRDSGRGALLPQRGTPTLPGPVGRGHRASGAPCSVRGVPEVNPSLSHQPSPSPASGFGACLFAARQGTSRGKPQVSAGKCLLGRACRSLRWAGWVSLKQSFSRGTSRLGA